eukprot:593701_1
MQAENGQIKLFTALRVRTIGALLAVTLTIKNDTVCRLQFYQESFADSESSLLVSLGSLQTDFQLSFWATFIPMSLLFLRCWTLLAKSGTAMREQYVAQCAVITNMNATIQMAQSPSPPPSVSPIASTALSVGSANTSWILSSNHLWSPIAKRVYMVVLSIVLTAYGIVLFALVTSHFDYANTYCNQFVTYKTALAQHIAKSSNDTPVYEAALNDHPELYFWDWCFYKVYPFDSICDCRNFRASFYP